MRLESLEELRVFAQIVESGSLSGAARALGLPANTVGRRLSALEDRLGCTLLHRTTRSQSLSEPGQVLLGRAQSILEQVEAAELALMQEGQSLAGTVRLSVPSVLTADMFVCLAPLLEKHPELRLQVSVNDIPVNPVSANVDVVIIGGGLSDSTLIARRLTHVQFVLLASQEYLRRHGAPESPEELGARATVHFRVRGPSTTWTLTGPSGEQRAVPVHGRVHVDDGRGMMDALNSGLGIGLSSERLLHAAPNLRRILPEWSGMRIPVFAIYPPSGQRSPRVLAVVQALQERLESAEDQS